MSLRAFQMIEYMNQRLSNIERMMEKLDQKLDYAMALQKNHLIRMNHGEQISDRMILESMPYNDLTPQKAFDVYNNNDLDFFIIDVTRLGFDSGIKLEGVIRIPLEELDQRYAEIPSKTTPVLIISETGLRSILACEKLVKKGFYNVNNISGGYRYWPSAHKENVTQDKLSA